MKNIFLILPLCLALTACNKSSSGGGETATEAIGSETADPKTDSSTDTSPDDSGNDSTDDNSNSDGDSTTDTGNDDSNSGNDDTTDTGDDTGNDDTTTDVPPSTTCPAGLDPAACTFSTDIEFINVTSERQAKFNKAIAIIKKVVASTAFRDRILNFTYNGQKAFVDTTKTNAQVYQSILDAAEELIPAKNNTMNMEVETYYTNNSTVGYTNSGTTRIYVNTKFFDSYQPYNVANNLFHEWLHKVGYSHAYYYSTSRDYSVPYAVGDIIEELGKQYM